MCLKVGLCREAYCSCLFKTRGFPWAEKIKKRARMIGSASFPCIYMLLNKQSAD